MTPKYVQRYGIYISTRLTKDGTKFEFSLQKETNFAMKVTANRNWQKLENTARTHSFANRGCQELLLLFE